MLSFRRIDIKPSGETSVVNERLIRTSGYKFTLDGIDRDGVATLGVEKQRVGGEHAAISFQILLSTGIFNVNVPYVCFPLSPLSVGMNGTASPFNDVSASPFNDVSACAIQFPKQKKK